MGRPKGSKNRPKIVRAPPVPSRKTKVEAKPKKICCSCPQGSGLQTVSNFYRSENPLHTDGFVPICKKCIQNAVYEEETGEVNIEALKSILRQIDRPWIDAAYEGAIKEYEKVLNRVKNDGLSKKDMVSLYFKNIQSLPKYARMSWQDGVDFASILATGSNKSAIMPKARIVREQINANESPVYLDDEEDEFELTRDIVKLFGQGYTISEYKAMKEKYDFISMAYPDITNLHTEALCSYVRYKVKEEFATSAGYVDDAEKWAALATKAADKAKINPSQLSQNDLQGGLNSFSELMLAVEQAADIIPILPRFKYAPHDAVDFTIWCIINYLRKAEGKPTVAYEDIYEFYDERKAEYITQYGDPLGIFKGDPTESNREKVKKFITLPKDYGDADG